MSQGGKIHQRMMYAMDLAFAQLLRAEARLENARDTDQKNRVLESLEAARGFLIDAVKLAHWLDTGEAGDEDPRASR